MRHPLSLEAFAEWLTTMPADQWYDYCDPWNCAVAQYRQFLGVPVAVHYDGAALDGGGPSMDPRVMEVVHHENGSKERTFGAALERARMQLTSSD